MRHSNLILREPEYMALLGQIDADFGAERSGGGYDYGDASLYIDDSGTDTEADFGWDDDYGADAPPAAAPTAAGAANAAAAMLKHPAGHAQAHKILTQHIHKQAKHSQSQDRLHPNLGSPTPTYRWNFSVNGLIPTVGGAAGSIGPAGIAAGNQLSSAPNIGVFTADTLTVNVPQPNFVFLQDVKVLSQSLLVGGSGDAYAFTPISTSKRLNAVPLNPAIPVVILATYTGMPIIGSTFTGGYTLDFRFEGWATPTGMPVAVQQ